MLQITPSLQHANIKPQPLDNFQNWVVRLVTKLWREKNIGRYEGRKDFLSEEAGAGVGKKVIVCPNNIAQTRRRMLPE